MKEWQHNWETVTVEQARKLQNEGYMVLWRPDRVFTKEAPDKDLAWVEAV